MENQDKAQKVEASKPSNGTKAIIKLILGMVLIILGLIALISWHEELFTIIKGCIGLFVILAGVITIASAKSN